MGDQRLTRMGKHKTSFTDVENRHVVAKGEGVGEGWIGSLGLADANHYIWKG